LVQEIQSITTLRAATWTNHMRAFSVRSDAETGFKLSVGGTCPSYLLEIEGLFTQRWRPGRTFSESVGGILEMDSSDWSNGIRYHTFDTRPDTEFKKRGSARTARQRQYSPFDSHGLHDMTIRRDSAPRRGRRRQFVRHCSRVILAKSPL
jgi:hypothetical protein